MESENTEQRLDWALRSARKRRRLG